MAANNLMAVDQLQKRLGKGKWALFVGEKTDKNMYIHFPCFSFEEFVLCFPVLLLLTSTISIATTRHKIRAKDSEMTMANAKHLGWNACEAPTRGGRCMKL